MPIVALSPAEAAEALRAHVRHGRAHLVEVQRALEGVSREASELSPEAPFKTCPSCGTAYATAEAFGALEYVGQQEDRSDVLEMRRCTCGSTIAVVLGPAVPSTSDTEPAPPPSEAPIAAGEAQLALAAAMGALRAASDRLEAVGMAAARALDASALTKRAPR